jgi:hypothetical protein
LPVFFAASGFGAVGECVRFWATSATIAFAGCFLFQGKGRSVFYFFRQHWVDKVACCFFGQTIFRIGQVFVVLAFSFGGIVWTEEQFLLDSLLARGNCNVFLQAVQTTLQVLLMRLVCFSLHIPSPALNRRLGNSRAEGNILSS